jgi:chromosomal replication initiator protein
VDGVVDIPLRGWPLEPADVDAASCRIAGAPQAEPSATRQDAASTSSGHFLAGPENRLVEVAVCSLLAAPPDRLASVDSPPESLPTVRYNPLVLYGPSGTGKSHLARGLAAAWKTRGHQRVVCTSAVDFARELAEAIETQAVEEFRAKHRSAALLVVEDLGMLATRKAGKLNAQEELIHTLDALLAEDRQVIVTASAAPEELPGILPALASRLIAGLTIPLAPPGPEARLAILQQLAACRQSELPESAARALAEGLSGTARELAGALMELEMRSPHRQGRIDLAAARQFLDRRNHARRPTLHQIALLTARHFSLRLSDLRSPARRRALVTARGVAVHLARRLTGETLERIGSYFGGRDHTTVLHSCRQIKTLMKDDSSIRQSVELLRETLWKT